MNFVKRVPLKEKNKQDSITGEEKENLRLHVALNGIEGRNFASMEA